MPAAQGGVLLRSKYFIAMQQNEQLQKLELTGCLKIKTRRLRQAGVQAAAKGVAFVLQSRHFAFVGW
ncbi:hypothetical protein L1281_002441 [Neisseria sp. HSC-16F19]|nr:hypothetical protein [Neisseria sp. HSC-16F19]MCP2041824.1 hypothetical protein [Neisseria sp. HSC-16F19]